VFRGTVKEYSTGTAVNPADDDTTYVWMAANNTIGSGIDGSGWPSAEHIKLAEIDVDADGVITAIRDLRGQVMLSAGPALRPITAKTADYQVLQADNGKTFSNLGASDTVTFTLPASPEAGTWYTFAVQAAYELRVDPGSAAIRDTSGATADMYKAADAVGEAITVIADANGDWTVVGKVGTWTEETV